MPCDSSYLNQNDQEEEFQRAAALLVYVYDTLGEEPPTVAVATAENYYATTDLIPDLCAKMKALTPEQLETVAYDAHSKTSRSLAGWWERHLAADAEREAREERDAAKEAAKQSGRSKLSAAERAALGIR